MRAAAVAHSLRDYPCASRLLPSSVWSGGAGGLVDAQELFEMYLQCVKKTQRANQPCIMCAHTTFWDM